MDADLLLFLGIVIGAVAFPTLIGSFSAGRSLRTSVVFGFIGGCLIVAAMAMKPGGYAFDEIPGVMVGVVRDAFK